MGGACGTYGGGERERQTDRHRERCIAYGGLVGKSEGKRQPGRPAC